MERPMRDLQVVAMTEWLSGIGLSKYLDVFAANGLGMDIVADVTETDFAAMGVVLGDRKRLMRAIAELRNAQGILGDGPGSLSSPLAAAPVPRESLRRHLTVLFCDLVGSTSLSHRLDPEDLDPIIRDFQAACTKAITRNAGYIARYMGDGILAYFGYPQAHEDDAERATRAALDITARIQGLCTPAGEQLHVRVGIATGLVLVVGEAIGSGESREQSVVGKTPNLAARLQALAEPDSVLITDSTHELLGDMMFSCRDLGFHQLKGLDEPARVWQVLDERRSASRFDATRSGKLSQLIGRTNELSRLLELWQVARGGTGRVALISGEAGIGKSRLCRAMLDATKHDAHHLIRYQCSPHHAQSPLHPVIGQLEQAAHFERDDCADTRLDKLAQLLDESGIDKAASMPYLAALLSIPAEHRHPLPDLSPANLRKRTIETLQLQVLSLSARKPVLLVMEDLHWADPTTLELLALCLDRAWACPVLAVLTSRPGLSPPWWDEVPGYRCTLRRLEEAEVLALIERVTAGRNLPLSVSRQIIERTDGVPLFVEELTRSVIESGVLQDAGDRYVLASPQPALAIPATLQETLMARLDRLGSVREVAQVAAALGREFSFQLLSKVTEIPDPQLAALLAQLSFADLIHGRGTPPDSHHVFKHSLVQGVAYETLLRARRVGLHARIAEVLQRHFPEVSGTQPEVVAHHYTEAQLTGQAIEWWRRAGQCNLEASANSEAVVHFDRSLSLLHSLPAGELRDRQELDIRIALGVPLMGTCGYTSPEFQTNTDRALEICERHADSERIYPVLWGQVARSFSSGDVNSARVLAQRFFDSAERQGNRQLRMVGHRLCGMTLFGAGELQAARKHLERSLALWDTEADAPLAYVYGADQRVAALAYLGRTLLLLGHSEQGLRTAELALDEAKRLDHANTTLYAEGCLLELHMMRREPTALRAKVLDVSSLAQDHAARNYQLVALTVDQIVLLEQGSDAESLSRIDRALNELQELNWIYWVTRIALLAAEVGARAGHLGWARAWFTQARRLIDELGQGVCMPELHHVHAELLHAEGAASEDVAAALGKAVVAGRAQGARWSEQRAAGRLAHLMAP